jgi:hypothetical protein
MGDTTVVWGTKVSAGFKQRVESMAEHVGTKADYLMAIMAFETGRSFNPAQTNNANPKNGPVGLIQFTEVAAKALGTTKSDLAKMTAIDQLDYVEKHLLKKKDLGLGRLEDLYAAVHWPAATGKSLGHVLYSKAEGKAGKFYRANAKLDLNGDGKVTLEEAAKKVRELLDEGEKYRG